MAAEIAQHQHGHQHGHHHKHRQQHADQPDPGLAELLELDGEVLAGYWGQALAWVRQAMAGGRREQIVDLGAGTGTGTLGLAQRFAGAEVTAVDADPAFLARIRQRALELGLPDRVRTVLADLDAGWPPVGRVDLAWASMSLHHLADPDRTLRQLRAAIRPGGLAAVAEFAEPLRFLPDRVEGFLPDELAGLEERCLAVLWRWQAEALPELGSNWASRLRTAGFQVLAERDFEIDLRPTEQAAARYARLWLGRLASAVAEELTAADRRLLAELLDPSGLGAATGRALHLRGVRTVTLARPA